MLLTTDAQAKLASLTPVGEADETVEVTVRPAATVSGRLVGPGGKPLPGAVLTLCIQFRLPPLTIYHPLKNVATDGDGRFTFAGLPGELMCQLKPEAKDGQRQSALKRFQTKAGQTIDLGELAIVPEK